MLLMTFKSHGLTLLYISELLTCYSAPRAHRSEDQMFKIVQSSAVQELKCRVIMLVLF